MIEIVALRAIDVRFPTSADRRGRPTEMPGFSVEFKRESIETYRFPDGAFWRWRA